MRTIERLEGGEPVQIGIVGALNSTIQNVRQAGFEGGKEPHVQRRL